jgi:hypothetical protein
MHRFLLLSVALATPAWADPPEEAAASDVVAPAPPAAVPDDLRLSVGTIESVIHKERVEPRSLELAPCATLPAERAPNPAAGTLVLQVVVRKGRADLVTVASADPGVEWLVPCLQRQLATVEWPTKKDTVTVPVTVEAASSD